MRLSKNTLNNLIMENQRKTQLYQTIITDLAITGSISIKDAEALLGYKIPSFLKTPDGQSLNTDKEKEPVKQEKPNPIAK